MDDDGGGALLGAALVVAVLVAPRPFGDAHGDAPESRCVR
jgi:hypothetical protein